MIYILHYSTFSALCKQSGLYLNEILVYIRRMAISVRGYLGQYSTKIVLYCPVSFANNTLRLLAKLDFSSDCTMRTTQGCRLARTNCAI